MTGTATPLAGFVSVDLVADRRGDNGDGSFTTLVAALVTDRRGNPIGDGVVVTFLLSPPTPGVTITQNGATDAPPNCDVSSYVAETGAPVHPQPGTALTCLRYVRSEAGQTVTVTAQLMGVGGLIQAQRQVRLPVSPTPTPSTTATPASTATATASGTITETATITATPPATGTTTVTPTPPAPIRVAVIAGAARPGTPAGIRFDLADELGQVYCLSFDLLIDATVFDVFQIANRCHADPTLTTHRLSVALAFDSTDPVGTRRFHFAVDALGTIVPLRPGPLVECTLPVSASAPVGPSALTLDRVLAGDQNGTLLAGVLAVNGVLSVDPNAPLATPTASPSATRTATQTATITATRSATATRTATPSATATVTLTSGATSTLTPVPTDTAVPTGTPTASASPTTSATPTPSASPTPSATPQPCAGDCNDDGSVSIDELVLAVNISLGSAPPSACAAVDRNHDGTVTIDELIAAVNNAVSGCAATS